MAKAPFQTASGQQARHSSGIQKPQVRQPIHQVEAQVAGKGDGEMAFAG
jgi:hypothetical protein